MIFFFNSSNYTGLYEDVIAEIQEVRSGICCEPPLLSDGAPVDSHPDLKDDDVMNRKERTI